MIIKFDKNYGKAYIVNSLYNKVFNLDFKYIFTSDSDICYNKTDNYFERLCIMATKIHNSHYCIFYICEN